MCPQSWCFLLLVLCLGLEGVQLAVLQGKGDFECPGDGIFSDPDNCQCYYNCANNHPFLTCCGEGTLWNEVDHDCDFPEHMDCGDRPLPGSTRPSTLNPTTATTTTTKPTTPATSTPSSTYLPTSTEGSTVTTASSTTESQPDTTSPSDIPTDPTVTTTTESQPDTTSPSEIPTDPTVTTTTESQPDTTSPSDIPTDPIVTTTTDVMTTSTEGPGPTGSYPGLPKKVIGMYILLADDTEDGYHTDNDGWEPSLYPYQQQGANVLFFTFINPETMDIPISFGKLAATRGKDSEGAVPKDTLIIFAIGGYAYSQHPNPWDWLTTKEKAEAMAVKVAHWRDDYGIDGIDLDIEDGAGSNQIAGPNMAHFIRKLKSFNPDFIVSQPTYGYPQVQAEIDVINASWNPGGSSNGLADSIGLMVYEGTQALQYVKNFAEGTSQWEGFPIKVDVPRPDILLGCKGSSSSGTISTLAHESVGQDLLGVMVWFCSVRNGLVYGNGWDCSDSEDSKNGYVAAMKYFREQGM